MLKRLTAFISHKVMVLHAFLFRLSVTLARVTAYVIGHLDDDGHTIRPLLFRCVNEPRLLFMSDTLFFIASDKWSWSICIFILIFCWAILDFDSLCLFVMFCFYLAMFFLWYYTRLCLPWLLTDLLSLIAMTITELLITRWGIPMNHLMLYVFLSIITIASARAIFYSVNECFLAASEVTVSVFLFGEPCDPWAIYNAHNCVGGPFLCVAEVEILCYFNFFLFFFYYGCAIYFNEHYCHLPADLYSRRQHPHEHVFNMSEHFFMWLTIAVFSYINLTTAGDYALHKLVRSMAYTLFLLQFDRFTIVWLTLILNFLLFVVLGIF